MRVNLKKVRIYFLNRVRSEETQVTYVRKPRFPTHTFLVKEYI